MKGVISAKLEQILRDAKARVQLRESLTNGGVGSVTVGRTTYEVTKVCVEPDGRTLPPPPQPM